MEPRIIELFHQSIEAKMASGEALAPTIAAASTLIVQQLLQEQKLLCCGNGLSASLSSMFSQCLLLQYRFERPGFPSISLASDMVTATAISQQHSLSEIYSRQVRTLGQPGDILVVFSSGENPGNLVQAIHTAHDRSMAVVAFTADGDADLSALLNANDIELRVINTDCHRVVETHLLSLFCLCDLIDQQLFGGNQ